MLARMAEADRPRFGARLVALARDVPTIVPLVASNLLPLAGVAWWGWHLSTVMVLYWAENGVIGLLNVPRIALAAAPAASRDSPTARLRAARAWTQPPIPFFLMHYGIFWVVHGVFVFVLFGFSDSPGSSSGGNAQAVLTVNWAEVAVGLAGLLAFHIGSFIYWDIGRGEGFASTGDNQMFAPYPRLFILHVTILVGGVAIAGTGQPIAALALLVVLKTAFDLGAHLWSHLESHPAASLPTLETTDPKKQVRRRRAPRR